MSDSEHADLAPLDWSPEDLRLVAALQLAPRASFARLASVLGMHERTVGRRYRALRRSGILRIFGVVDPMAVGQQSWSVRVRCRPDTSETLASALAARDDVAWVGLTAAGSEVSFNIRSLSSQRRDLLLTRTLPRTAHVLGIEAAVLLYSFLGMNAHDWSSLQVHLSEAEADELAGASSARRADPGRPRPMQLEVHDRALLEVLARDGRAGVAELAAAAGISEGRAARRLASLLEHGAVVIDLDLATEAFGYAVSASLHLRVTPARLHEVGEAIAALPEVAFVGAMSGRDNLMVSVTSRSLADLYAFATSRIGALDGIQEMEVLPFMRVVKQSGALVVDGRLVDRT
jgi:DNA-binding Lrp family transcriptional regulator